MNKLSQEKSPYLKQHEHNPVNWFPWEEEAFLKARSENKPIFLSIGYSTCYWCHMMEKDSFEHEDVAEILNEHFVSIKVDREERPDVDKIYMDAVVSLTGQGGWPMSVFLTPDLEPFYAGTFFWKEQFKTLLRNIAGAWKEEKEKIVLSAKRITESLSNSDFITDEEELDPKAFLVLINESKARFDSVNGGFGRAPKFPPSMRLRALLRLGEVEMVKTTLYKMAYGGIYDHLAGGFSRYSTDEKWLVPHFEKMLYDNALLIKTYLEAFLVTKDETLKKIGIETLEYTLNQMLSSDGVFYAAEDAGEVGKEGEYYVWKSDELKTLLTDEEYNKLAEVYGILEGGNFEGNNVLNLKTCWQDKEDPLIKSASTKLLVARSKRLAPHLDEKILTEWNAMMVSALAIAYQVTSDEKYLAVANKTIDFIKTNLYQDKLYRRYIDGEIKHGAVLDDYANLIDALINLYAVSSNEDLATWAISLQNEQDTLLFDNDSYLYSKEDSLLINKKELNDGATPSGNAVSILNLLRFYELTHKKDYQDKAVKMLSHLMHSMKRHPGAFSQSFIALDYYLNNNTCWGEDCELPVLKKLSTY